MAKSVDDGGARLLVEDDDFKGSGSMVLLSSEGRLIAQRRTVVGGDDMSNADVATTSEMDHLDQLGAQAFEGYLVRKDLVRKYSRQYSVPTYVVEFLLGRYASTDPSEIEEGLRIVEKQLQGRTVNRRRRAVQGPLPDLGSVRSSTSCGPSSTPEVIPMPQRCPAWRSRMPRSTTN